jgi:hypothetical protein
MGTSWEIICSHDQNGLLFHLGLRKLRRNGYFLGVEDLAIMCSHDQWVEHLGFPNTFS